uniref:Uncharacterized protein n=1 Tax=Physcomitrium patens TaxID=3218 RepID=A0A2K1IGA6_PHYPA|nr:hypothetical protein PHYPA_028902 [Physcomitrium patens]
MHHCPPCKGTFFRHDHGWANKEWLTQWLPAQATECKTNMWHMSEHQGEVADAHFNCASSRGRKIPNPTSTLAIQRVSRVLS